jgi:hypothetical protein
MAYYNVANLDTVTDKPDQMKWLQVMDEILV